MSEFGFVPTPAGRAVLDLYVGALGRLPDPKGYAFWLAAIEQDPDVVVQKFITLGAQQGTLNVPFLMESFSQLRSFYGDRMADTFAGSLLEGSEGTDVLIGGAGDDTIEGGAGDDVLSGGSGADVFIFNKGDGNDRVIDADASDVFRVPKETEVSYNLEEGTTSLKYEGGNAIVEAIVSADQIEFDEVVSDDPLSF